MFVERSCTCIKMWEETKIKANKTGEYIDLGRNNEGMPPEDKL